MIPNRDPDILIPATNMKKYMVSSILFFLKASSLYISKKQPNIRDNIYRFGLIKKPVALPGVGSMVGLRIEVI